MITTDYSKLSKEELIQILEQMKKQKKYGLVWDEENTQEQFDVEIRSNYPVLCEIKNKEIIQDYRPANILIEGDNYHSLRILQQTHHGKIDLIYIDPPYNTGSEDFKYNDNYIDKEDSYRHSKWLSFMKKRLDIAKELLSEEGMLAISIDDNEMPRLVLLLEEMFGENNVKTICVKMSEPSGVKMASIKKSKGIAKLKEYVIIAKRNGIKNINLEKIPKKEWDDEYRILVDNLTLEEKELLVEIRDNEIRSEQDLLTLKDILNKIKLVNLTNYFKEQNIKSKSSQDDFKRENSWRIVRTAALSKSIKTIADDKREDFSSDIMHVVSPKNVLYFLKRDYDIDFDRPRAFLLFADEFLELHAGDFWSDIKTTGLDNEGSVSFQNGKKPLKLIKRIIKMSTNKNSIVLDFFAGSGTTGHAVLELNKEDCGNRQFILCTNNENKICEEITYERIKNAINGLQTQKGSKVEGLGGNLKYFKCDFIPKYKNEEKLLLEIATHSHGILQIKENCFEIHKRENDYSIYHNGIDKVFAIYDNTIDYLSLEELISDMNKINVPNKMIYCFGFNSTVSLEDFATLQGEVEIKEIPRSIINLYENSIG